MLRYVLRVLTQKREKQTGDFFQGLPSPAAAALIAGLVWVMLEFKIAGPGYKMASLEYHGICWLYYGKQPPLLQWKGNKFT